MIPGSEPTIRPLRRMIYAGRLIQVISDEDAGIVLDSAYEGENDRWTGDYRPLGRFLVYEEPVFSEEAGDFVPSYTAMDNSTGDCWTESFHSLEVAVRWLAEECDTDEAYDADAATLRTMRRGDAFA